MKSVLSVHENGGKGVVVSAETNLSNGLPVIILVGFAGKSLDESKERIRSSFQNSSLPLPKKRITVNLSPSDLPKDGAHYDLAIALSILIKAGLLSGKNIPEDVIVLGELGLDGTIKPVRGLLGKLIVASELGFKYFIIPKANIEQAGLIEGIHLLGADNLKSLVDNLSRNNKEAFSTINTPTKIKKKDSKTVDFSQVVGQARAKRAMEIAAAGGHNLILNGPPGVGKSMLAKAMPGILSPPTHKEIITITHLHSLTSDTVVDLMQERPFRAPHHSSSNVSIIGGGQRPRPGEVSLAHGGVLFLDEFPEFNRSTIESLRQPLEDGVVTVARAKDSVTYPADFMLIATKNPCPCGYYGSTKSCSCTPIELVRYQKKLSGPILDRIDIHVTVDNINHKSLLSEDSNLENSEEIQKRVIKAHESQTKRQGIVRNSNLSNKHIKKYVGLSSDAKDFLDVAAEKLDISARVYMKIIKIARTIADLDNSENVDKKHIAEAIQYRPQKQEV